MHTGTCSFTQDRRGGGHCIVALCFLNDRLDNDNIIIFIPAVAALSVGAIQSIIENYTSYIWNTDGMKMLECVWFMKM